MPSRPFFATALAAFLAATVATPGLGADDIPGFDPAVLVATYGAEQGPLASPATDIVAIITIDFHADHSLTLRKFAKAPEVAFDNSATGTWKFAGDTLTITLKASSDGTPIDNMTFDFTVSQGGRVLTNTTQNGRPLRAGDPGLGVLLRDFTSPKLPPVSAPATAPATSPATPVSQPASAPATSAG